MDRYSRILAETMKQAEDKRNLYRQQFETDMLDSFPDPDRTWDESLGRYVDPVTQQFWFMFRCGAECEERRQIKGGK